MTCFTTPWTSQPFVDKVLGGRNPVGRRIKPFASTGVQD